MHGRVKKKKKRVLAAVVLPCIDFMHGRLKIKIKIKTMSFRSSRTQIIGQYFFFCQIKKGVFCVDSSTLCHMTTINNIIYITQTLLGQSLKQLLFEYKIRTLTIKFHLIWSNNRPIIQIKPTHPNKILKKGHETCYSLIFGNTAEIRSVGQSSVKVLSPKKKKSMCLESLYGE